MEAEKYLDRIKRLQIEIDRLMEKYNRIQSRICSPAIVSYNEKVQHSQKNRIEEGFITLEELYNKIVSLSWKQARLIHEATGLINQLTNAHEIEFLFLRYVLLKTIAETANDMNMTARQIYRLKDKALINLNEIYINKGKYRQS